jgi:replication initiation protein RepC
MRVMIGLSEAAWLDGAGKVGRYAAAAILITVLEKSMRSPEQISSPGGYFRAMIDRAVEGSLHLEKSLFGLADGALKRARDSAS